MKKMLITLIVQGESEEELRGIQKNVFEACSCDVVSLTTDIIDEPKKGLKIPAFMCNSNYKNIVNR